MDPGDATDYIRLDNSIVFEIPRLDGRLLGWLTVQHEISLLDMCQNEARRQLAGALAGALC
jgi:hypothetical protein